MMFFNPRLLLPAPLILLFAGCAEVDSNLRQGPPVAAAEPTVHSDFEDLLDFGANLAAMNAQGRSETCRGLAKRHKETPDKTITLQLMTGRLLSDACGDIPKILEELASIPPESYADDRTRRLVAIHTEALKRINSANKKIGSLERKQKSVQNVLDAKETAGSKKTESHLLREKLEAIRSMEKQLDETGDAK